MPRSNQRTVLMKSRHLRRRLGRRAGSLVLVAGMGCAAAAEVIHTEPSQYSPVIVYETGGERCMKFGSLGAIGRQTCVNSASPRHMVFDYTRTMMTALYVKPDIRRALVIGLGGGTLPMALAEVVPEARIDTVELDPAVVKVAERFFGFKQGPRQHVHVADGRAYVQHALASGMTYDLIMLDAFDSNYIPKHLMTQEFFKELRGLLAPGGVLAANTFSASKLYQRETATYAAVFGEFFNLRSGNRIVIAVNGNLPNDETLRANANRLSRLLQPYGIDAEYQLSRFARTGNVTDGAQALTDAELATEHNASAPAAN